MGNNFSAQQGRPKGLKQQPQLARRPSPVDITMVDVQPEIPSPEDIDMRDASDQEISSRVKGPPGTPQTRYAPPPGGVKMFGGADQAEGKGKGKGKEEQPGPVFQFFGTRGIGRKGPQTEPQTEAGQISKKRPSQPVGNGGNNATKRRRLYQLFGGGSNENPVWTDPDINLWTSEEESSAKDPATGESAGFPAYSVDSNPSSDDITRYLEHADGSSDETLDDPTRHLELANPFWRTTVNPDWEDHLIPQTEVGLANEGNLCYRNVVLQMLFHLPIFLHWLVNNQNLHTRPGELCKDGPGGGICKPCHFLVVVIHYWDSNLSHVREFGLFWERVFQSWNDGANKGQQDVVEFWPELLRQFKTQTRALHQSDLDTIFNIPTVNALSCKSGLCATTYRSDRMNFLPIHFTEKSTDPTPIQTLVRSFFNKTPVEARKCPDCATPQDLQQWLGNPPEVLLVHLNRIEFHEGEAKKIVQRVSFTENLKVSGEFLDPRLPAAERVDVNYELSSVILHRGETTHSGHYRIISKSPAGLWMLLDDETPPEDLKVFDHLAANELIQSQAYIFAYRRLPLRPDFLGFEDPEAMDTAEDIAAAAGLEGGSDPFSAFMQQWEAKEGETRKEPPMGWFHPPKAPPKEPPMGWFPPPKAPPKEPPMGWFHPPKAPPKVPPMGWFLPPKQGLKEPPKGWFPPLVRPGPRPRKLEADPPALDVAEEREIARKVKAAGPARKEPPNKVVKRIVIKGPKPELRRSTRARNNVDYKE